jgi:hypothetical protein
MLKTPNNFYFVYEFCNGGTLESVLRRIRLSARRRLWLSSSNSFTPFRFSISIISCIEISNLITFFSAMELWSWGILDFAKVWKRPIWRRRCLAHSFTWLHRFWEEKSIALRLIYGHLESFCDVSRGSNFEVGSLSRLDANGGEKQA